MGREVRTSVTVVRASMPAVLIRFPVVVGAAIAMAMSHCPAAWSSPLEDATLGGAVFTGPTHPHSTAIYVNPAALGLASQGTHVAADFSLRLDQLHIERIMRDQNGSGQNAPTVDAVTLAPGGSLAVYNVGGKVSAGAAVGIPMNEDFIADRPELGYHVLGGHHRRLAWLTLAISFRLSRRIYLGTGLSLTTTSFELSFLRDTALEGGSDDIDGVASDCNGSPCGIENPDAAERFDVDVGTPGALATQNVGFNGGLVYRVSREWWVGLGIQSPAGFGSALSLQGKVNITPAPRDTRGPEPREAVEANAEVVYRLPQTFALGVRGQIWRNYQLIAAVHWQTYSRHDEFDLRIFGPKTDARTPEWYPRYRGMRDVLVLQGGLEGKAGGRARIGGRLRFESGATATDAHSPLQIAGPNLSLIGGGEWRPGGSGFVISGSYGLTWFPSTDVTTSLFEPGDYLDCVDSEFDIESCTAAAQGRAIPSAAGTYGRLSHAARLSLRYHWL